MRIRLDRSIISHNRATNIVEPSFEVGDFFLVRRAQDHENNLKFSWRGPCGIFGTHGPLIYDIVALEGGKN